MWGGWLGDPKGPANSQSIESQKTEYCPLKGAPGTMGPHPHTGQNAEQPSRWGGSLSQELQRSKVPGPEPGARSQAFEKGPVRP